MDHRRFLENCLPLIIDSIPMTGSKYWEELIQREVISYDDAKVIRVGYQ